MQTNDPMGACVEFVVALGLMIWTLWLLARIARASERAAHAAERAALAAEHLARSGLDGDEGVVPLTNRRADEAH